MNFLFIYDSITLLGGIETLISRMAQWLIEHEHQVTLLVRSSGIEKRLMPQGLRIIELGENYDQLCLYLSARRIWNRLGLNTPAVIKTFDVESSWIGTILSNTLSPNPLLIAGCYTPAFIPNRRRPFRNCHHRLLIRNVERNVDGRSRIFMSAEQLNEFKATYGPKQEGLVWHLPVDGKRFIDVRRSPKRGSIISVGRLERMKEYNLYMIGVIKNLLKKGYDVTWTVYGDGTFEKEMRKRIADESLQERIHLKGRLEYSQFGEVLTNAYLFVGMGTAIIEASFCKVPGVVAMAYDTKGATYGPLYKFPLGNSGEFMEFPASSTVESEIERIMKMSSDEYAQEMNLVQAYAEHYGIDNQMEAFMGIVRQAQVAKKDLPLILSYYFYNYFCFPKFRFRFRSRFACRTL